MELTTKIGGIPSPIQKELEHVAVSITDGNEASLISGVAGKRIRIWRFNISAATKDKSCVISSGSNAFPSIQTSTGEMCHHLVSCDGVPVYTCNAGEDFKADPSDTTNWYFYIVYSIE